MTKTAGNIGLLLCWLTQRKINFCSLISSSPSGHYAVDQQNIFCTLVLQSASVARLTIIKYQHSSKPSTLVAIFEMHRFLFSLCLTMTLTAFGQYPFEKFPAIKYKEYDKWKQNDNLKSQNKVENSLTVPKFFEGKDSLTIKITSLTTSWDSSFITVYRSNKQLKAFFEPLGFEPVEPVRLADFNGDHLTDIKLILPYMGNGTAALNVRVVYLLQHKDGSFTKVSYFDKMDRNRPERDFNGDGNYEIITMTLMGYQNHSYWLFNLFNFKNNDLVNVNDKYSYPILIQFLYRDNYKITNKMSRQKMKEFAHKKPEEYDRQ